MSIREFWYLTAPELWKMGYRRCEMIPCRAGQEFSGGQAPPLNELLFGR
jgi:hypothetical protein